MCTILLFLKVLGFLNALGLLMMFLGLLLMFLGLIEKLGDLVVFLGISCDACVSSSIQLCLVM